MLIRDIFATAVQQRIEPVVKVNDRRTRVLQNELNNLVVTPQWERYLRSILDDYAEAADRDDEQGIGIWVSGFFGSGKSLLVKVLGLLLADNDLDGQSTHDLFLGRVPATSPDRSTLQRYLTIIKRKMTTTAIGGNLHAMQANQGDSLALIAFKLFADQREFTQNWGLAWAIEHQIDERGLTTAFRQRASDRSGETWEELRADPEFYQEHLYAAAAEVLSEHFSGGVSAVERAVVTVQHEGLSSAKLIDRLRRWCAARDGGGRRHKLLLQLDEVGQWIASGNPNERTMQVQALAETAATSGAGRIWIAVTAHGDVQALRSNVQQEQYAKINQRFAHKCKLTNDDISQVVERRVLNKTAPARAELEARFIERSGLLTDLGTLQTMGTTQGQRDYPTPDAARFATFYPYLPWTVGVIPDVVKGIAQASGREEALTGSNRTMIGVVQGAIIETPGLLEDRVGRLISLADLYDQLAGDAPIETKTDLNRLRETVSGATDFTPRVARALYLLGEADYIATTLGNVTRALVDTIDADLATLSARAKIELDRLVKGGYAKQVGEQYVFLTTQQRSFQERVRGREQDLTTQNYELSQALKEYDSEDALRFDQVGVSGRELRLKLEIDGRVTRNPTASVTLRVYSQFQRALDRNIEQDAVLKQRSNEDTSIILVRLDDVQGLRQMLALALATDQVANEVLSAAGASDADKEIARQARQNDLTSHKAEVRRLLSQAVRGATLFYRGTAYQPVLGESPSAAIRATLADILRQIYARLPDLPYQIGNEEVAVRAALAGNTANVDLQALGVFRADGTLNEANPLLSTLRSRIPVDDQFAQFVSADALRTELEQPPFGWDAKAVKVGLALLLRTASCRLIDTSQTLTDPNTPEVFQALTKETRFRTLRVQGIKTELDQPMLQQIRAYIEALFGVKPPLVAATMNARLNEHLSELVRQADEVRGWADTARCPLPTTFETGRSLVQELLNLAMPQARLPRFREQADTLIQYVEVLQQCRAFRSDHGDAFLTMRDFFTSTINAETDLPAVRRFIEDWRTVVNHQQSVTEPRRWNDLSQAYHAARQAVVEQVANLRQTGQSQLTALDQGLADRLREAGVPDTEIQAEIERLSEPFSAVRTRIERPDLGLADARGALTALSTAEMGVRQRLRDLQAQYQPNPQPRTPKRVRLSELAGSRQITTSDDLDVLLRELRERLEAELAQQPIVLE